MEFSKAEFKHGLTDSDSEDAENVKYRILLKNNIKINLSGSSSVDFNRKPH